MSPHAHSDPTLEWLHGLPRLSQDRQAADRTRRHCHAAMTRLAARRARRSQREWQVALFSDGVLVLSMGLYLLAVVVEAVRVVGAL